MKDNIFKTLTNEQIAELIYDEFVKDDRLNDHNVRKKIKSFEERFWSRYQTEENLLDPELEHRQWEIFDIVWFKIIELEKELVLKRNKVLNSKSDEELVAILFNKVKNQADLSSINLNTYWSEIGVENIFDFPQATYYRCEKINNLVWQKAIEL